MVAVPADTPYTAPPLVTVAILVAPELHAPPLVVLVSVVLAPVHTLDDPEIVPAVDGAAFTVTVAVTVPQEIV